MKGGIRLKNVVKIILVINILFALMACKKENKQISKKYIETKVSEKKDFHYEVPYINHDYAVKENNYINKSINNEEADNEIVIEVEEQEELNEEDEEEIYEDEKNIDESAIKEEVNDDVKEEVNDDVKEEVNDDVKEEVNEIEENTNVVAEEKEDTVIIDKKEEIKKGYYSANGKYLGQTNVKVIDVSYYQKEIDWNKFYNESDCYGVILRLGYYNTLDKSFERNLSELKRLNIPYGIYLFSYATSINGSRVESEFVINMIDKYDISPSLGIYYDIESFKTTKVNSDNISKNGYNYIVKDFVSSVSNHVSNKYKVGVYSGRWYAMNRLGSIAKSYVSWVAEYNSTLKYDGEYLMWQYTSKGSVPGIIGNVDISYLK